MSMLQNESRAIVYLRVSTDRQAQKGIALPTQEERCLEHAKSQGFLVDRKTDIYTDGGESARSMDRPALLDLLARCKKDKAVKAVIIYDVSRLARNRLDFALIKQTLGKAGVILLSATEPINDTPEGQMLEGVLSTVAEFFSAQSARKVKANMRRKAESGGWPNIAPYGYKNRKEKLPDGTIRAWIEPNPEEAKWVRQAFELFGTGTFTVKVLTRRLNREGFAVRHVRNRRSRLLHHSQLERMLRNKIYVGVIEWAGIVNENGTHEHLIDPELFYRVGDLLRLRSSSTNRTRRHRSLFKKFAFCAECASAMTIDIKETSTTRTIRYLRCRKVQKGKPVACSQSYFAEEKYTVQLGNLLGSVELPERAVADLRKELGTITSDEELVYGRARADIERQLESVRTRQQNLIIRSLDDDPRNASHRSLFDRVRSDLDQEEARLSGSLTRLKVRLDRILRILGMALEIAGRCSRAFSLSDDPDYQGLIARVIFKKVEMRDGKITEGTLNAPLVYFRRWMAEKPLGLLSDLALLCAPTSTLVDGCNSCHTGTVSLSDIKDDLLRLQELLTPEEEAEIESCYYELRGRGFLP
jgi:site-specific DNA recombinase